MEQPLELLLTKKKLELEAENYRVMAMLRQCGKDHEAPPKDYWAHREKLKQTVWLLEQLKGSLDG